MPDNLDLDRVVEPPLETADLRRNLAAFLDSPFFDPTTNRLVKVGNLSGECTHFLITTANLSHVGQTNELVRTRIRRHLTNQRTDAVAMSVLDPLEVLTIQIWPLPEFQTTSRADSVAQAHLDALEHLIYQKCLRESAFGAVLNEKDPPEPHGSRGRTAIRP